ncbi:radical SAM protein [Aliivibrio wodanis]|uniref:radical SAM protein n=1 Tax=Aliivibrio wodanis TaxID=80852 RepID=UPI00406C13FF
MTSINFIENDRFVLQQTYLLLTRKCNISCTHCIRTSSPEHTTFMPESLANSIIKKVSSKNSKSTIMISGGEPTLHPNFTNIVRNAANQFQHVVINTNGIKIRQISTLTDISDLLTIQVSLDGDRISHDMIRGKGTFNKTINNIIKLSEQGFKIEIATTVTNNNLNSIILLDRHLKDISFTRWSIKRIVGYGRADDSDDLSTEAWNSFIFSSDSFFNSPRIKASPMFTINSINQDYPFFSNTKLANFGTNCGTGRSKLYINPNGSVYPCACMEDKIIGDFNFDSFDLIKDKLSLLTISPNNDSICYKCTAWNICKGGCPGVSARFNNYGDPRCPVISKVHLSRV